MKFMAAVHYAYLQMKMPGPGGPITVHGDLKVALACMVQRADHLATASKPEGGDERLSASVPAAPRQRMITCDEVPVKEVALGDGPVQDHTNRWSSGRQIGRRARLLPAGKRRRLRLETGGHARGPQGGD